MPDSFEFVFWLIVVAAFWLRGLAVAAKKQRERDQQALAGDGNALEGGAEVAPQAQRRSMRQQWVEMARQLEQQMQQAQEEGRPGSFVAHVDDDDGDDEAVVIPGRRVSPQADPVAAPRPAARSETRRSPYGRADVAPQGARRPSGAEGRSVVRREPASPVHREPREVTRHEPFEVARRTSRDVVPREPRHPGRRDPTPQPVRPATGSRPRSQPPAPGALDRLSNYPPLARAVILSEILGAPPGLRSDRLEERWDPEV